jgi:hypothetical protein
VRRTPNESIPALLIAIQKSAGECSALYWTDRFSGAYALADKIVRKALKLRRKLRAGKGKR